MIETVTVDTDILDGASLEREPKEAKPSVTVKSFTGLPGRSRQCAKPLHRVV